MTLQMAVLRCSKHCAALLYSHDTQRQEDFGQTGLRCFGHPFSELWAKLESKHMETLKLTSNKKSSKILAFPE